MAKQRMFIHKMVLFFCLALFVNGCSDQIISNKEAISTLHKKEKVEELVFWHTYSDEETRVFEEELIPLFQKKYPEIKITSVRQPYNEHLKSALISKGSSGQAPDVVRIDIAWVPEFASLGLLEPLDSFKGFKQKKKKLYANALETNLYNGLYYGLPVNLTTKAAIYNEISLNRAGINEPPETMNDFLKLAEKQHGIGYIGMKGLNAWDSLPYFWGLGGMLTNSDYTQASGYFNSKESIHAVSTIKSWKDKGLLAPNFSSGSIDTWNEILEGQAFMAEEGPWFYSVLSTSYYTVDQLMNVTIPYPFPVDKQGKGSILGGENLVIMNGTEHRDAAWTFMKWMTSEDIQQRMFNSGILPANKAAANSSAMLKTPYMKAYVESLENARLRPPVKSWSRMENVYTKAMEAMIYHNQDIRTTLNEAANKMDQLLKSE
ncbi:extracellular solute-binding protein [Fictibacillus terranigra]|uniref:Extracellular solute-binding protein n=1 Tax=Fictibacillus terranigra TaxID=3058424 RepID=A0ABT8EDB7_9BACL|nr:extracellular solute-binding protein [Fictibacillus sp. CENA-BCM004]MDN4075926.1 extracellular solute-binding protein [Fictibacillus sp. CENA-BCM004]